MRGILISGVGFMRGREMKGGNWATAYFSAAKNASKSRTSFSDKVLKSFAGISDDSCALMLLTFAFGSRVTLFCRSVSDTKSSLFSVTKPLSVRPSVVFKTVALNRSATSLLG